MFGDRLEKLREKTGLSQGEVAKRLGMARTTYSGYENNAREPDQKTLDKLATFFDVSVDYLLGRTQGQKTNTAPGKLDEYLELDFSDEDIMKRMTFKVGDMKLTEEEVKEFLTFVRFQKFKNAQAASSKYEEP